MICYEIHIYSETHNFDMTVVLYIGMPSFEYCEMTRVPSLEY